MESHEVNQDPETKAALKKKPYTSKKSKCLPLKEYDLSSDRSHILAQNPFGASD